MSNNPGCFIVIEGVDGAGKTTIATKLIADLQAKASQYTGAVYAKEPGSTKFGAAVREAFLHQEEPLDPMTEVLALLSCKNELLAKIVTPAVRDGWIVVVDRYTRSLMAMQGGIRKIPYQTLTTLLDHSGLLVVPNLEIYLSINEETQNQRRQGTLDTMDQVAKDNAKVLRQGFQEAPGHLPPYRSITIDANRSFDLVYKDVLEAVMKHLTFHRVAGLSLSQPVKGFVAKETPVFVEGFGQEQASMPQEDQSIIPSDQDSQET